MDTLIALTYFLGRNTLLWTFYLVDNFQQLCGRLSYSYPPVTGQC